MLIFKNRTCPCCGSSGEDVEEVWEDTPEGNAYLAGFMCLICWSSSFDDECEE